jgi:hypothetical protein
MSGRWLVVATVLAGALALPAVAQAGGWATVSLSSTPDGLAPREPWVVDLEILQHGVTPLDGVKPTVILTQSGGSGATHTFDAKPTGKPGFYRASAEFSEAGTWRYAIDDGFSRRHEYPPVQIGGRDTAAAAVVPAAANPPVTPGDDDGPPWFALGAALLAGLGAAGLVLFFQRRGVTHGGDVATER